MLLLRLPGLVAPPSTAGRDAIEDRRQCQQCKGGMWPTTTPAALRRRTAGSTRTASGGRGGGCNKRCGGVGEHCGLAEWAGGSAALAQHLMGGWRGEGIGEGREVVSSEPGCAE